MVYRRAWYNVNIVGMREKDLGGDHSTSCHPGQAAGSAILGQSFLICKLGMVRGGVKLVTLLHSCPCVLSGSYKFTFIFPNEFGQISRLNGTFQIFLD